MTRPEREILNRSLLYQFLGGLGIGVYLAEICWSKHLQYSFLRGLSPEFTPPVSGTSNTVLVTYVLLVGIGFLLTSSVSFVYAKVAAARLGLSRWEVYGRDARSNALLALLLTDLLVIPVLALLLGRDVFMWLSFAYSGVFVVALWVTAKVMQWIDMRGKEPVTEADPPDRTVRFVWLACGIYIAVMGALGVLQCLSLGVAHIDSVVFEQMYWNTLHGDFARGDAGAPPFTADHVSVTMYLLLPLYLLYPSLETISLFQTIGIGLGGVPAYLIAREFLRHRGAALMFAIAYLLSPALHYSNLEVRDTVFDPNSFSATLILWAFYFALREKWWSYLLMSALTMLCREDLCPSVFMMGLYLAIVRRHWKFGLAGAVMGLGWLAFCIYVIVPRCRTAYGLSSSSLVFNYFAGMGEGLSGMVSYVFCHPVDTLVRMMGERDLQFIAELSLPFGMLALLAPEALLMAGPAFAFSLLADEKWVPIVSTEFWYHIVHIPLVYIASVIGASRLPVLVAKLRERFGWKVAPGAPPNLTARSPVLCGTLAVTCSLLLCVLISKTPLSLRFYDATDNYRHYSRYVPPLAARHIPKIQEMIPESEPVVATHYLTQKFSHRPAVWRFPGKIEEANWVVFNWNDRFFHQGFPTPDAREAIERLYTDPSFERVFEEDGLVVFRRK